jgi:hypothetical protein
VLNVLTRRPRERTAPSARSAIRFPSSRTDDSREVHDWGSWRHGIPRYSGPLRIPDFATYHFARQAVQGRAAVALLGQELTGSSLVIARVNTASTIWRARSFVETRCWRRTSARTWFVCEFRTRYALPSIARGSSGVMIWSARFPGVAALDRSATDRLIRIFFLLQKTTPC